MLTIWVGDNGDGIQLTGFHPDQADYGPHAVEEFRFADGTTLSYDDLVQNTFIVHGSYGDDDITGSNLTDRLYGFEGQDRLWGELGNDTLTGGTENDELAGGEGCDCYVFHVGDGVDTIIDTATPEEGNTIYFADTIITRDDIRTHMEGTTLVLEYGDQGDAIRLSNFDYNNQHVVDTIEFSDGTQVALTSFVDPGTEGDDVILGTYREDVIDAKGGDDTVTTFESNDTIYGGTGNDTIDAGDGDDLLVGGVGNDSLRGGSGQDTYIFNIGDGVDTITDTATLGEGNVIRFGDGITQSDLTTRMEGTTLVLAYGDQGDEIHLLNYDFNQQSGSHVVETLQFVDGTAILLSGIVDPATEGDDVIKGSYFGDTINGRGGNDTITSFEGDDIIYGGSGDDTVDAGAGYDLLVGGQGHDTLTGGPGNDTYVFNVGDGVDTIIDDAYTTGEGNVVRFGPGITLADLKLSYQDATLIIDVRTSGDRLRLEGFYPEDALYPAGVDTFEFSDGTTVSYEDLINRGFDLMGTDGDDTILGTNVTDRIRGLAGNDVLDGGTGADILMGGAGNDTYPVDDSANVVVENLDEGIDLIQSSVTYTLAANVENLTFTGTNPINGTGNELSNILTGNAADNVLDGGAGADTLVGGLGNDTYLVDNVFDNVVEDADEGIDIVQSSVSYTLQANLENLILTGLAAINGTGNELDNVITGNAEDNVLDGGAGADTLIGGLRNDTYIVVNAEDVVTENANEGTDTVQASMTYVLDANLENLVLGGIEAINGTGNELDNALSGNSNANVLTGGARNDILAGGAGNDTLEGGSGDDSFIFNLGDGVDTIIDIATESEGNVLRFGSGISRNDLKLHQDGTTLIIDVGTNGDSVRLLNFDKNNQNGSHVVETVQFADGSQVRLVELLDPGTEGDDVIITGSTDDVIRAKGGNDYVSTDGGNDWIDGGSGNDTILAGDGNDYLDGGTGGDAMTGGPGDDVYVVDSAGDQIVEKEDEGMDTVESSVNYTLGSNLENLILIGLSAITAAGNGLDNTLTGNTLDNMLTGAKGNDVLDGGAGSDRYVYNRGDGLDRVTDPSGQDTVVMGSCIDRDHTVVRVDPTTAHLRLLDCEGNETNEGMDIALNSDGTIPIETVMFADGRSVALSSLVITAEISYGTNKSDFIRKGRNNDTIYALDGNDIVYSGLGNDSVYGGKGNDWICGEEGDDCLYGEAGNDFLFGSFGKDSLFGGTGNDVLDGDKGDDDLRGNEGNDVLYSSAGNDLLEGGLGNDILWDTSGNDTYVFNLRDGRDTILDLGGSDTLRFGQGITRENISVNVDFLGTHVRLLDSRGRRTDDSIDMNLSQGWVPAIETMEFADGTSVNLTDFLGDRANPCAGLIWLSGVGSAISTTVMAAQAQATMTGLFAGSQWGQLGSNEARALINNQVDSLVSAMATFAPPASSFTTILGDMQQQLKPLLAAGWK